MASGYTKREQEVLDSMDVIIEIGSELAALTRIEAEMFTTVKATQFTEYQKKTRLAKLYTECSKRLENAELKWRDVKPDIIKHGLNISKVELLIPETRDGLEKLKAAI